MVNVIPRPKQIHTIGGEGASLDPRRIHTYSVVDRRNTEDPSLLRKQVSELFPQASIDSSADPADDPALRFTLETEPAGSNPDEYRLRISEDSIEIHAYSAVGALYALQTLRQLLHDADELPCMEIHDWSAYSWRGFMLDCSRHFFPVDTIYHVLGIMLLHKLNRFHWHLTDDQGWRVPIAGYPELTGIGANRKDTRIGGHRSKEFEGREHGGYYSEEDIAAVLEYAALRGITVIPEIDLPGHMSAAIAAYPSLGCRDEEIEVETTFGIFDEVLCLGRQESMRFVQTLVHEICRLFPGPWVHIGGDEVTLKHWKSCEACTAKKEALGLRDYRGLQDWFTGQITELIEQEGKRVIGWNEILDAGVAAEGPIVQAWMPLKGRNRKIRKAAEVGRQIIFSDYFHAYLDQSYGAVPLSKAYALVSDRMKKVVESHPDAVLGFEMPLWSEWVGTTERLEWQLLPRLSALADRAWAGLDEDDPADFLGRLEQLMHMLQDMGIGAAVKAAWEPEKARQLLALKHLSDDTAPEQEYYTRRTEDD